MKLNVSSRIRKIAVATALSVGAASVLAGVTPLDTAAKADAMYIGPAPMTVGGLSSSALSCSAYHKQVRLTIDAAVQTGYVNGQWIAYRYYLTDGTNAHWSQWSQKYVHHNGYRTTSLFDFTFNNVWSGNWSSYVELLYWDGARWTGLRGNWSQEGQAGYYYVDWKGYCMT